MSLETHTEEQIQVESVTVEEYAQYLAQVQAVGQHVGEETVTFVQTTDDPNGQVISQQTLLVTQPDGTTTDLGQAIQAVTASNPNATVYVTHHALEDATMAGQFAAEMGLQPGTVLVAHTSNDLGEMERYCGSSEALTALQPSSLFITQPAPQPEPEPFIPPTTRPQHLKKPIGKGPFTCDVCSKVFNKWNQYQRHMKSHDDDKPFRCFHCTSSFNIKDNLNLHLATHVGENEDPICPECGKKFSRIASLKAHIMLHEKEETLMCPECGDEFTLQSQLDRHVKEHRDEQAGTRSYPCRQCTQEFRRLAELREHMKQHYKIRSSLHHRAYKRNVDRSGFSHKCTICTKTFQKPSQLERHNRIHTGERPFKCNVCEKAFNQKGALHIHMTKHTGEKPYICDFCDAPFAQRGNLRAHIKRVHPMLSEKEPSVIYRCEECSCVFRKLGSLNAHISRMHAEQSELPTQVEMRRVSDPGRQVTDVIEQLLHLSGNNENIDPTTHQPMEGDEAHSQQLCEVGDVAEKAREASDILQLALENSGLTHTTTATGTINSAMDTMAADITIHPFGGVTSTLQVHDASGTVKRHVVRKVNGIRWHQCTYCSKEFKKPSDLVRHIRIHTHEKPYKCSLCFRAFAVKSTLTAHEKTHTGVKEFRCIVCDKHFSTQGSLKVHLRLHTGAKPFDCLQCHKKFRTSAHLKNHMQSHYRDSGSPNKIRRTLRRPSKPDMSLPDIPLQEPILITDTGLIQQPSRNTLIQQYLGESSSVDRPYKCAYCQRSFKKSSHLKQHIRSHTGEKPYKCLTCLKTFVSNGVLKAHIRTHTGTKSYKCLICDCMFTTNGSLKRHMSTHSEVRPFMCPYCQKTFKTSVNCKKHMKTHRQELAMQTIQDPNDVQEVLTGEHEVVAGMVEEQTTTTTLTQADLNTPLSAADQQAILQEALNQSMEHQLPLNTQVYNPPSLGQQTFTQSLLNGTQFGGFNQNQFTVQGGHIQSAIDINSFTPSLDQQVVMEQQVSLGQEVTLNQSVSQPISVSVNNPVVTTMASTSMQNILQTREPEVFRELSPEPTEMESPDGKRGFKCGWCGKSFKKSSHLKQHTRSHTGEKPYKCHTCSRRFVSPGVLKTHMKTHTGVKEFECYVCNTNFTTNGSLTRHMTIHSSLHPFKCPHCDETFRTAVHCKRHLRVHRATASLEEGEVVMEKVKPRWPRSMSVIQVTEEDEASISKGSNNISVSEKILLESASERNRISELRPIEHTVQLEDSRFPHICHHCNKGFKKPSDLVRHVRIHTGEKPYSCEVCHRSFTVKSTLDSHIKTHASGLKRYKCHVCASMFSTKGSLKVHMRLHTGAKPFKCPHCDQKFRTSGHRKSHILSHFKDDAPRKRRLLSPRSQNVQVLSLMQDPDQQGLSNAGISLDGQVITLDQSQLQQQALASSLEAQVPTESTIAAHALQGLEGIQLHFTSNLGQGIQIGGLDPSMLQQTVQIDGSLLQQLQQQGNINITINPNLLATGLQTGVDTNPILQNVQIQPVPLMEGIHPNMLVQPMSAMVVPGLDGQQTLVSQTGELQLEGGQETTYLVAADGSETQVSLEQADVNGTVTLLDSIQQAEIGQEDKSDDQDLISADKNENLTHEDSANVSLGSTAAPDGERNHVCMMCHKAFKRASHLKEHLITHVPAATLRRVRATPHVCLTCNKSFQKPSQLERHQRIHTGERPFVCTICSRAFNQKNALMIHLKKHSGDKPHRCSYCELAFTQKGNLKTHIKRAHHADMVMSMNLPHSSASATGEPEDHEDHEDPSSPVPQPITTISVISDNTTDTSVNPTDTAPSETDHPVEDETLGLEMTELFQ